MIASPDDRGVAFADVEPIAELLKSLANPYRLMIVYTLIEGERAVSELERELNIRQPSLSQHLGSLRDAGLVVGRREAKAVFYRIADERVARIIKALHEVFREPTRRSCQPTDRRAKLANAPFIEKAPTRVPAGDAAFFAQVGVMEER